MRTLRISGLLASGFVVENVTIFAERVSVEVRASAQSQMRPLCGNASSRVHSRYGRRLLDLPVAGRPTPIILRARRFFCDASACRRRVFTERFDGVVIPYARRMSRLDEVA